MENALEPAGYGTEYLYHKVNSDQCRLPELGLI